jgi:hypothetical protein
MNMRNLMILGLISVSLAACGGRERLGNRSGLDEFAVARRAPLVVPPDFALVPPRPGTPRPQEADSSTQALQAMFGGPTPRSGVEGAVTREAGNAEPGIRSTVADPDTNVVNKGQMTRDILNAPASSTPEANAGGAPQ